MKIEALQISCLLASIIIQNIFNLVNCEEFIESGIGNFNYCLRQSKSPDIKECVGRAAISYLQHFDEKDNFTIISDFVSKKDDKRAARSLFNMLDTDPIDFRGILENAGAIIGQRSLEWHMDGVYPGLMLKVGPTADVNSVAEFALDPSVVERQLGFEEPTTARILTKQYLLPFLLGIKFNLIALVPLIFTVICLLLKKSLFFAKLAIYISSVLGVGGAAGALGGLTGGGLSSILGGFGGGLGGGLGGVGFSHSHAQAAAHAGAYYPAKTQGYNHYDIDELHHHHNPYKRNDRKVRFEEPREYGNRDNRFAESTSNSKLASDNFYDYEKHIQQERNGNAKQGNIKLGQSSPNTEEERTDNRFKASQLGWQAIDIRI